MNGEHQEQHRDRPSLEMQSDDLSDSSWLKRLISQAVSMFMSVIRRLLAFIKAHARWLRWLVPLLFVVLVIQRIEWQSVLGQVLSANVPLLLLGAVAVFGAYWLASAWRWQVLLRALDVQYRFSRAFQLYLIGSFAGFLVSDGLGAFARGLYAETDGYSVASSMASVVLDKLAELIGLAAFGLLGVLIFPAAIKAGWLLWAAVVAMLIGFSLLWLFRSKLGYWASRRLDRILSNRLHGYGVDSMSSVYDGLRAVSWKRWSLVALITLLVRLTHYGAVYILARSIGITLPYFAIVAVMSLVGIAVVLPVSVAGGIGIREGMLVGLFALLGQPVEQGLSLALLIFLTSLSWRMLGMVFWLRNPLPYLGQT